MLIAAGVLVAAIVSLLLLLSRKGDVEEEYFFGRNGVDVKASAPLGSDEILLVT